MAETEIKKINGRTLCDNQARTDINKVQQELDSMVFNETDPTVPEWAKASTKPTYTAEEVGALPSTTKIPSKTSDLTNDSGFLIYIPSIYVTEEELEAKHYLTSVPDHYVTKIDLDNRGYLTESDIEVELDQFITEDEVEATIEGEISAVKDELQGEIEQGLESHNTDTEAHNDIRLLIEGLTTRLNTLADSDDTTLDQMSELVAYIKSNRTLIEGVTTNKVNVSDIIDNLTTNVANKPLSAAQGVALKTLIDALQTALNNHTSDGTAHITAAERTAWNGKTNQEEFNELSEWTHQAVDEIVDAVLEHRSDKVSHITAEERTSWNGKASQEEFDGFYDWTHQAVDEIVDAVIEHRDDTVIHITAEERTLWNGKANQTDFNELSEWAHQAVDELVDAVIEPNKAESAFNLVSSDTLSWNGDTTGKVAVYSAGKILYVHVSNIVPTAEDLQGGGMCAWIGSEDCPFVSSDIVETSDYIIPEIYDSVVIAKKDGAIYNTLVFPKQGIYFAYDTSERRVESLTINGYTGFVKPILKMENMTPHGHDWYGKAINKGNTVRSDNTVYDGYVKVSDAVPTEAELQKGGVLRYYNVEDGKITGDLIVGNYLESPYSVVSSSGEIWIASDGIVMVQIKADGVYFRQDQNDCIHSLTINGYEGFNYNVEKVPAELLPADFLKQIIREVIEEIIGDDTDSLRDINDDELYDALNRKLITKE